MKPPTLVRLMNPAFLPLVLGSMITPTDAAFRSTQLVRVLPPEAR